MFDVDEIDEELKMLTNGASSWDGSVERIIQHPDFDPEDPEGSISTLINKELRICRVMEA